MVLFCEGKRIEGDGAPDPRVPTVAFLPIATLQADAEALQLEALLKINTEDYANRFESHPDFDCLVVTVPAEAGGEPEEASRAVVYCRQNLVVILYDPMEAVDRLMAQLDAARVDWVLPFDGVVYALLNFITDSDAQGLSAMEDTVTTLEDDIADHPGKEQLEAIRALRRRIMKDKRYFESLLAALEDLEEGGTRFISEGEMRALVIVKNRVERALRSVLNLRDYVTQVREAYQAQMDISLNQTMKLFTVITAVFSPLTLLVGWYGMNLQMPEYDWAFMYPAITVIALLIVIVSVVLFRRKRWF